MAIKDNFGHPKGIIGSLMLSGMNMGHSPMAKWAFTQFDVPDDGKIADIGCGGGFNVRRLLERSKEGFVYGVDVSEASVKKSKKANKRELGTRCEILQGSANELPFEDNSISLITAFETVYFWRDLEKCFREVFRTMEDGGRFIVINDPGNPEKNWEDKIPGMKSYTPEQIKEVMGTVGFTDIEISKEKFMFCVSALAEKKKD